jgi:hypothetical protein
VDWIDDGFIEQAWEALFDSEPFIPYKSSRKSNGEEMITLQRNNIPQGGAQQSRGVQFLKPIHVTNPKGMAAKIYKVTSVKPDNFGNPYTVYFNIDGAKYSKGFKPTSDNLASLVELFGADETKWIGKSVTVGKLVDDEGGERLIFTK